MKKHLIMAVIAVALTGKMGTVLGEYIPIHGAYPEPSQPTPTDVVTITAHGEAGYLNSPIHDSVLRIMDTSVRLDIIFWLTGEGLPAVEQWSHSRTVGTLPADSYSLMVRTFAAPTDREPTDVYTTSFTVVPEPARLLLLGLGGLLACRSRR